MTLTLSARDSIAERLQHLQSVRDRVVIDADTHPSDPALYSAALRRRLAEEPNYFHGRPISGEAFAARHGPGRRGQGAVR